MVILGEKKTQEQPVYEMIKRQDIEGAFVDALDRWASGILERLDNLISLYAATTQPALWTWGNTSRWGYDKWW